VFNIDTSAAAFGESWGVVQDSVTQLYKLFLDRDIEAVIQSLQDNEFRSLIMNDPKLLEALNVVRDTQYALVAEIELLDGAPDVFLRGLIDIDMQVYVGKIGASADELKQLIARCAINRLPESAFAKVLKATGLQPHQANSLANDSLRKFSRNVRRHQGEDHPEQLYIYSGPADERTSAICMAMLSAPPMTMPDIDAKYPGTFSGGGHYGCRHEWTEYTRARQRDDKSITAELERRNAN